LWAASFAAVDVLSMFGRFTTRRRIPMNVTRFRTTGATVFWKQTPLDRRVLGTLLTDLSLYHLMPNETSDVSSLRHAVSEDARQRKQPKKQKMVQALKKPKTNGFEVLDVSKGETTNEYDRDTAVRLDEFGGIVVTRGMADEAVLQEKFLEAKHTVSAASMGGTLADFCESVGGTPLKHGMYWIPEESLETWSNLTGSIAKQCAQFRAYTLKFVLDDEGIDALRDAIVAEMQEATERMNREIAKGDLGETALIRRQIEGAGLQAKLSKYEAVLGETMDSVRQAIGLAMEAAASATATLDTVNAFSDVFA
jgi:methyl-accepting chemotaxis protein